MCGENVSKILFYLKYKNIDTAISLYVRLGTSCLANPPPLRPRTYVVPWVT